MSRTLETDSVVRGVLRRVAEGPELRRLAEEVRGGARVVSVGGLGSGAARALALACLQRETGRRLAVVVQSSRDLEAWERDLCFWGEAAGCAGAEAEITDGEDRGADVVLTLPASESDPY